MIDRFVGFCLERRVAVIVLAVLLAGYGIYAWETLSVEAYPELGDVAAQVTTQIPGLAAEEVEQLITVPLEREINGTPGLLLMRSSSTFGLSLITVLFRDGYEDYWARQRLLERINQAVLPPGAAPSLDPVSGPGGEIYRYTLESDTKNLQELSEIQRSISIPSSSSTMVSASPMSSTRSTITIPTRGADESPAAIRASSSAESGWFAISKSSARSSSHRWAGRRSWCAILAAPH